MTEKHIQSEILKYLNSVPECIAENESGNASQSGRADISGCYKGRCFKLEVKRDIKKYGTTLQQERYLLKWKRAGAAVGVCRSVDQARSFLEAILKSEV